MKTLNIMFRFEVVSLNGSKEVLIDMDSGFQDDIFRYASQIREILNSIEYGSYGFISKNQIVRLG